VKHKKAIELARSLRKNSTPEEVIFWKIVRNRGFQNLKFYRQYLVKYKLDDNLNNYFIADFYCHKYKLIIEIDGPIHLSRKNYDTERETVLRAMGFKIIRYTNEMVRNDMAMILRSLSDHLDKF